MAEGSHNEFQEVAKLGGAFRGVIHPTGPRREYKTVLMYVAVSSSHEAHEDKGLITPDCVTLGELRGQIDKLKDDLEWLYKELEQKLWQTRRPAE